jgi:hypothetical protein
MLTRSMQSLLAQAVAIEEEDAREAGTLGFMARAMVQATMPHKKPVGNEHERQNGNYTLTMLAPSRVGLPYGTIPRLLLAWISTEAVRTQDRTLVLGDNLSAFMRELDLVPTGGRWGTITRLRSQMERLFSCAISCTYSGPEGWALKNISITSEVSLWWEPKEPSQAALWESTLKLTEEFFKEVTSHPVPIDIRALKALKKSPLALDVYFWLTYRMSYLKANTVIPWNKLAAQFGADYKRDIDFRVAFTKALRKVLTVYQGVQVEPTPSGLQLRPSRTHIKG